MKILFFGLGSIGRKHAALLAADPDHQLFSYQSRLDASSLGLAVKNLRDWQEVQSLDPEIVFITNPTFLHIDTALKVIAPNRALFVEKPLDLTLAKLGELLSLVEKHQAATYVAYNLRFHPVIDYLKTHLPRQDIAFVHVQCLTNLLAWRPGADKNYSYYQAQGGGVVFDLSHELDYVDHLFGPIQSISGTCTRRHPKLTVDADDYALLELTTPTAPVRVELDLGYRQSECRRLTYTLKNGEVWTADLNACQITSGGKTVQSFPSDRKLSYKKQMDYFLNNLGNPNMMNNVLSAAALFEKICRFKEIKT